MRERPRPVVRAQVEPRIVERRRRVRQDQALRRRRGLVVICVIAAVTVAAIGVVLSPLLDVDRIDVVGSTRVAPEEIVGRSGIERGAPLVSVDLGAARASLRAHHLVAAAQVTRTWPGSIRITVVEERPLVLVRHDGVETVVSASGRVLEPADGQGADDLFVVVLERRFDAGTGDRVEGALRAAVAMVDQMHPDLRGRAAQLVIADDDAVALELSDGAAVRIGPLDDVPAKLLAIETTLAQIVPECLESLDVTVPRLATARRAPGCEAPPPTVVVEPDADGSESDADEGAAVTGTTGNE